MVALNIVAVIFIVILIVLAFVFLVMQLKNKRTEKKVNEPEVVKEPTAIQDSPEVVPVKEEPEVAQLRAYVSETRAKGYSDEQIKAALLEKGWDASLVSQVLPQDL